MIWTYDDKSDPKIPSRCIDWCLNLFIFQAKGSIGWKCWTLHLTLFKLFSLGLYSNLGCGRSVSVRFVKWGLAAQLSFGWRADIFLGVSQLMLTHWLLRRAIRRMTPEKRSQFQENLRTIPED